MRTNKFNAEYNIVTIIDELIIELSYIKNGDSPSIEKLQKGIDLIEYLFSLSDELREKSSEDKLGLIL